MSLSPVQAKIIVDSGLFDDAIRAAIKAIQEYGRTWGWRVTVIRAAQEKRHRVRVQYRRKSRGHR